ncbi:MAG: hypothetical protein ACREC0_05085 [Methylocella sp.]
MRSRFVMGLFLLAQAAALCWVAAGHAQSRDPELTLGPADGEVIIEANGATLGEILDRLFTDRGTLVDWRDQALAGKVIQGSFKGPIDEVAQRLLAGVNYIAISASSDGEARFTRVVIFGSASPAGIAPRRPAEARARANPPASPGLPFRASPGLPFRASPGLPFRASPGLPFRASQGLPFRASQGLPFNASRARMKIHR